MSEAVEDKHLILSLRTKERMSIAGTVGNGSQENFINGTYANLLRILDRKQFLDPSTFRDKNTASSRKMCTRTANSI